MVYLCTWRIVLGCTTEDRSTLMFRRVYPADIVACGWVLEGFWRTEEAQRVSFMSRMRGVSIVRMGNRRLGKSS